MNKLIHPLTAIEQKRIGRRAIALMPLSFCARVLTDCASIILCDESGRPTLYPEVVFEASDPEGPFMNCAWDEDGQTFEVDFAGMDNPDGGWVDMQSGTIWLRDQDGHLDEIAILNRHIDLKPLTVADVATYQKMLRILVPSDHPVAEINEPILEGKPTP